MVQWPVGLAILVFAAAGLARAAEPAPDLVERVAGRAAALGVARPALGRALEAVEQAAARGLPADSVADKILEGLAKGVPAERLGSAASDLLARLEDADEVLTRAAVREGSAAGRVALDRVAAALLVLRDKAALLGLADELRGADAGAFVAAARELSELAVRGVPTDEARPAVAALVVNGYPAAEIDRVSALFDEYRAEGGEDPAPFLVEVERRGKARAPLADLVDPFGEQATPIQRHSPLEDTRGLDARPGEKGVRGETALEKITSGKPGANPSKTPRRKGR